MRRVSLLLPHRHVAGTFIRYQIQSALKERPTGNGNAAVVRGNGHDHPPSLRLVSVYARAHCKPGYEACYSWNL